MADRAVLHAELRRMSQGVAGYLAGRGEAARTVTTKVRYPDFSIRSRSTTRTAGIDDADTIGDLACSLLDRALRDRPGPLRLVGVGVTNLEPFRQLALGRPCNTVLQGKTRPELTGGAGRSSIAQWRRRPSTRCS